MVISEGWAVRFGLSFCHGTERKTAPSFRNEKRRQLKRNVLWHKYTDFL